MKTNIPRAAIHVGKDKKTFSAQVSNEAERRGWDEKRYQLKNAELDKNNHYNFSRNKLNFEVTKGGKIVPLGSNPVPLHKRLQQRFDELGFKPYMDANHPDQISRNSPNCTVGIIFSGDHEVFNRLAFGDQQIDTSDPSADHSHIKLQKPIYDWALDTYRFACRKWGEENVIGFCVHCDETSIHAHVQTIPVWQVKKRGRVGNLYISNENPDVKLSTKEWKALPKEERANYTKTTASKEMVERVSYAKVWGETKEEKPKYLSDLHTDYHKEVGQKYGLERGIPYNELSAEEKRARRHKDKVTLEAERQAKEAVAQTLQAKEDAQKELSEILEEKAEAEKDLKSAKSGIIAKLVNPSKHKKEEEEKHTAAVEEGKKSVMDAIIKATNLSFANPPTPEYIGKRYREYWDAKNELGLKVKKKDDIIAEKDKVIDARNKTISELNAKVTKLATEINGLRYKITLIDEDAVSSLRQQLVTETCRADKAETDYKELKVRWNSLWENPEMKDAWNQVIRRKEREKKEAEEICRQKERYEDILDRLIRETADKLRAFRNTSRIEFSEDERISLCFGIIAHCLKKNLDPTKEDNRTKAVEGIFSNYNLSDSSFGSKCCMNWTKMFASQITVDTESVDSFKATVKEMCLSNHYVSLMGGNGAANTLTNWDGTKVQGLGAPEKKKGRSV